MIGSQSFSKVRNFTLSMHLHSEVERVCYHPNMMDCMQTCYKSNVQMAKLSSIVKRSSTILTWVAVLVRDEELDYVQMPICCW